MSDTDKALPDRVVVSPERTTNNNDAGQDKKQTQMTQPTQPSGHDLMIDTSDQELLSEGTICRLVCTSSKDGTTGHFDLKLKPGTHSAIEEWTFGRNQLCDFVLPTKSNRISNKHFKLWLNKEGHMENGKVGRYDSLMVQDLSTNGTYYNGSKLVKGNNYMITQGDEISVGIGVPADVIRYVALFPISTRTSSSGSANLKGGIADDFLIKDEVVGSGAFATVKKGIERSTGKTYAVKIVSKKKAMTGDLDTVSRELLILKRLDHPGIVRLKAFYEDADNYYLVMEFVSGGDLMDFVAGYGSVGEVAGREIARQILEAIKYVHELGISHRDLKPDNILIAQDDPVIVKITDFGLAKVADTTNIMKTFCGTLAYVAPEVISSRHSKRKSLQVSQASKDVSYSSKVDMWSLGCLVFVILTAHLPFSGSTQESLFRNITTGNYHESLLKENDISIDGRQFVRALLEVDFMKRLNAKEALEHPWFKGCDNEDSQISLSQSQSHQKRIESQKQSQKQSQKLELEQSLIASPKFVVPKIPASQTPVVIPGMKIRVEDSPDNLKLEHATSMVSLEEEELKSFPKADRDASQIAAPPGTFLSLIKDAGSVSRVGSIHVPQGCNPFVIGRIANSHYQISESRISKIHCMIMKKRHPVLQTSIFESPAMGLDDVWLLDCSTNACFINGKRIGKGRKARLSNGDRIHIFVDLPHNERLSYKVVINDGTGLFNGGQKSGAESSEEMNIIEQDEYDKKLFPANLLATDAVNRGKRAQDSVITTNPKKPRRADLSKIT
ncbi:unnamed protein product [Kuraishia capsulata CBS 1993]|uniref:Serine/threonine-protein kinase RAD53 n=1 Tax=Kuraishia capsulata CBS 1993 TaxID=1382522 RepID=W6MIF7_9ASCO|nr:uncharacterized protein KUCA_T00001648001 [Kuraishia capsulata CBS 1993]CDK25678.1 unnamed protein product [Kuraishia capsulata CBS 1993]